MRQHQQRMERKESLGRRMNPARRMARRRSQLPPGMDICSPAASPSLHHSRRVMPCAHACSTATCPVPCRFSAVTSLPSWTLMPLARALRAARRTEQTTRPAQAATRRRATGQRSPWTWPTVLCPRMLRGRLPSLSAQACRLPALGMERAHLRMTSAGDCSSGAPPSTRTWRTCPTSPPLGVSLLRARRRQPASSLQRARQCATLRWLRRRSVWLSCTRTARRTSNSCARAGCSRR
mmetsp:Transcript_29237/g.85724  ORF Transcript_29237/g.85724 Transcript_29237/m.85724 type:complete len:236 (+) Transcript_29237:753-1460(+)